jgi:hypothetical protein
MTRFRRHAWIRTGVVITATAAATTIASVVSVVSVVSMTAGCTNAVGRDESSRAVEVQPIATHAVALQIEGMT